MRLYEMFIGDFEKAAPWNNDSIKGCRRFVERAWGLKDMMAEGAYRRETESDMHRTIKKVTEDIDALKCNTAIAAMMSLINKFYETGAVTKDEMRDFIIILNPFAPHVTEELWQVCGFEGMVNEAKWPSFDEEKCKESEIEIVAQINGKVRAKLTVPADIESAEAIAMAKADENVAKLLEGMNIVKELYVKGRLVNIVVKPM